MWVWALGKQKKGRGTKPSTSGLHLRRKREKCSDTQRRGPCWTVSNKCCDKRTGAKGPECLGRVRGVREASAEVTFCQTPGMEDECIR